MAPPCKSDLLDLQWWAFKDMTRIWYVFSQLWYMEHIMYFLNFANDPILSNISKGPTYWGSNLFLLLMRITSFIEDTFKKTLSPSANSNSLRLWSTYAFCLLWAAFILFFIIWIFSVVLWTNLVLVTFDLPSLPNRFGIYTSTLIKLQRVAFL